MVVNYEDSKLSRYGILFRNWPGPGEAAADMFGLSHAVIIPAGSNRVIIGGQVGLKDDDSIPSDLVEEIRGAFDHVERALKAAGLGDDAWEHVYKLTMYVVPTPGLEEAMGSVLASYLKKTRPATVGVCVHALMHPALHFEVTVEAFLPQA